MFTNDSHQLVSNKIMILYAIKSNGGKMLQTELMDFFMSYDYMNFFEFQQYLNELFESHLLTINEAKLGSMVEMTDNGFNSLKYFSERIDKSLRKEIDLRMEIAKAQTVVIKKPEGRYIVQDQNDFAELMIKESGQLRFYLKVLVADRQAAEILISRWYDDYEVMSKELKGWLAI